LCAASVEGRCARKMPYGLILARRFSRVKKISGYDACCLSCKLVTRAPPRSISELREHKEVPRRIFDAELLRSVKRCPLRHHRFRTLRRGHSSSQIVHLDIQEGGASARQSIGMWIVLGDAGIGLIHEFDSALLQRSERDLVVIGDLHRNFEAHAFRPEL